MSKRTKKEQKECDIVAFNKHVYYLYEDDCHFWRGRSDNKLRGIYRYKNKKMYAHEVAWLLFKGIIPIKKEVKHRCDTPDCVNPNHLFLSLKS